MEIPARIARYRLTMLAKLVEAGERVIITRYGKPVAELRRPGRRQPEL